MASFAAAFAGTVLASTASAQTITDPLPFNAAITAVRKGLHTSDKFAEPMKSAVEGKSFRLTMPAVDSMEGGGSTIYDYKDGVLTLDVSPRNLWPKLAGPDEALPTFLVSSSTENLGSYIGQNAFGATTRVTSLSNSGAAIAIVSAPKPMLSPMRTDLKADLLEDSDWWTRLTLPPSEAKAIAMDTVGVVEGTYTALPSGRAGDCYFGGLSATIDRPTNFGSEICYLGSGPINRIPMAAGM